MKILNQISIIHSADMHLGSIVSAYEREKNIIRMNEIETTGLSVLEQAKKCDIVLLPGDIFDSSDTAKYVCDAFLEKISSMPSVRFFYSCGNHDPYVSATTQHLILNCPDNLHIFGYEDVECITIEEIKTRVYGISFQNQFQKEGLCPYINDLDSSYINILCIHADVAQTSHYNPISIPQLEKTGFDYVALGHQHKHDGIKSFGKICYSYSGNPEPRGFDEIGDKGYVSGTISKDRIDLKFVPASKRKYHTVSVDISSCTDTLSVVNEIISVIKSDKDLWRITLCGENNIIPSINVNVIKEYLNAFHIEISDNTTTSFNIEEISRDFSLIGLCAKESLTRIDSCNDEEKKIYEEAFLELYDLFGKRGSEK